MEFLIRSGVRGIDANGTLPAPGVYGLPEQWPHVHAILERAGFTRGSRTEMVFLAEVDALPRPAAPRAGLTVERTLGVNGTCFGARLAGEIVGYVEVENRIGDAGRLVRQDGWADIGNLWVAQARRRRGIGAWLLGQAADWLRLGHADRLLTTTTRDWSLNVG